MFTAHWRNTGDASEPISDREHSSGARIRVVLGEAMTIIKWIVQAVIWACVVSLSARALRIDLTWEIIVLCCITSFTDRLLEQIDRRLRRCT